MKQIVIELRDGRKEFFESQYAYASSIYESMKDKEEFVYVEDCIIRKETINAIYIQELPELECEAKQETSKAEEKQ